jgi:hypothetical protein
VGSKTCPARIAGRVGRPLVAAMLTAAVTAGCSGGHTTPPAATSRAPSAAPATATTPPGPQASGVRTVLSTNGLNVRAGPTKSARVLGTAAEGVQLTVLGYTSSDGGWFKVRGATVTGWISAEPTLSAPGSFSTYSSAQFSALYPAGWAESALPASPTSPSLSSVLFRPATGAGDIVVTVAGSVAQLPHGRAGYARRSVSQVVACGTTTALVVYQQTGAASNAPAPTTGPESLPYLAEIRLAANRGHALGVYADLPDLGRPLQVLNEFVASMTFSSPHC